MLQKKVLSMTTMVDRAQVYELLGASEIGSSARMQRYRENQEILCFTDDGHEVYPLFQFDVDRHGIFPVIARLIAMKPEGWSDLRLLHWLSRPHLDFGTTPAEELGTAEAKVIAAFEREIVPPVHG